MMKLFFLATIFFIVISTANADNSAFLAGMATTVAVHESGHLLTAASLGYTVKIKGASITYIGNMPDRNHLQLASAGFQAQWILTESIFCANENKAMSDYAGKIPVLWAYANISVSTPNDRSLNIIERRTRASST